MRVRPVQMPFLFLAICLLTVAISSAALAQGQAPAAPQRNVLDALKAAPNFKTLVKAIETAELTAALSGSTSVTLFAPTDEAFAKVPKAQMDAAMANKDQLTKILKNHIIEGQKLTQQQLGTMKSLKSAAGQELVVEVKEGTATVGGAKLMRGEIQASNGVIFTVDAVIMPKTQ